MSSLHLLIKGKVQGVFYRASARNVAENLAITGWVKNTKEGNVEAVISGNDEKLLQFVNWCRQGPPAAAVSEVIVTEITAPEFQQFSIVR